jgi:hypothetical protein
MSKEDRNLASQPRVMAPRVAPRHLFFTTAFLIKPANLQGSKPFQVKGLVIKLIRCLEVHIGLINIMVRHHGWKLSRSDDGILLRSKRSCFRGTSSNFLIHVIFKKFLLPVVSVGRSLS